MKQSTINAILSYVTPDAVPLEINAATKPSMTHEHADKIASKHKSVSHTALTRAIKSNDKAAVHDHFNRAKTAVFEAMNKHHGAKVGPVKPAAHKDKFEALKDKSKAILDHSKTALKKENAGVERDKAKLKAAKAKHQSFHEFAKEHPAYHAGKASKTGSHSHPAGSLAGRAFELGHTSRKA